MNKKGQVGDVLLLLFIGLVLGLSLGFLISNALADNLPPSDETVNDICKNLSGGNSTQGYIDGNGKLICIVPSYDHTTNIIIKTVGDE